MEFKCKSASSGAQISNESKTFNGNKSKTFDGQCYITSDYAKQSNRTGMKSDLESIDPNNPFSDGDFNQSRSLPYTEIPAPEPEYCASRLPCGICMILGRMCPKIPVKYEITCKS